MAARQDVEILMKGSLHTDELLKAVLAQPALRTGRRLSHIFRFDVPLYDKPLLITDAAINIRPSLLEKVDIVQNAIDFARVLGTEKPKVAILSAVETVTPAFLPHWTLPPCARWQTVARSRAVSSMARWRLTTPCPWMRCASRALTPEWLGRPIF